MNFKSTVQIHLHLLLKYDLLWQFSRKSRLIYRVLWELPTEESKKSDKIFTNWFEVTGIRQADEGTGREKDKGNGLRKDMIPTVLQKGGTNHWSETLIEYFPLSYFG